MTEEEQKLNWYAIMENGSMTAIHNIREYIKQLEKENNELCKFKKCINCKHLNVCYDNTIWINGKSEKCQNKDKWEFAGGVINDIR